MAKTGSIRHTHKYFKRPDGMWACALDGCTHYMPKNMAPAPAGHKSICHSCEKEFDLYPWNMKRINPVCDTCSEELDAAGKYLDSIEKKKNHIVRSPILSSSPPKQIKPAEDEIESEVAHAPDCDSFNGGECSCM